MSPDSETRAFAGSDPRDLPDDALLAAFVRSDPVAAPAFVSRFERRVYGFALTVVSDPRAAEDVAEEVFVRAWRHAAAFDVRRGSVATWLLTITRNAAIDLLRVRRPQPVDVDELLAAATTAGSTPPRDPAETAILREDVHRLQHALARLPPAQRRAVVLAGMWGLSAREVADHEQIPLGTAKTRIRIALRRLRIAFVRDTHERQGVYS